MTAPDYNTFNKFLARPGPLVLRLTDKRHTLKKRKGDIIHIDTHTDTFYKFKGDRCYEKCGEGLQISQVR